MNELPEFPVVMINNRGGIIAYDELAKTRRQSLAGICAREKFVNQYFDAHGTIWAASVVKAPYPVNIWTKIVSQVYNPWFEVDYAWRVDGNYELSDLKQKLCECVDSDDDILTQFSSAKTLKALIQGAKSFHELFHKLKKRKLI